MGQENDDRVSEVLALFFRCLYGIQRTAKRDWRELDLTSAQLKVLVMLSFEDTLTNVQKYAMFFCEAVDAGINQFTQQASAVQVSPSTHHSGMPVSSSPAPCR